MTRNLKSRFITRLPAPTRKAHVRRGALPRNPSIVAWPSGVRCHFVARMTRDSDSDARRRRVAVMPGRLDSSLRLIDIKNSLSREALGFIAVRFSCDQMSDELIGLSGLHSTLPSP